LEDFLRIIVEHERLRDHVSSPTVSYGNSNLYMRGALEHLTRENLPKRLVDLIDVAHSSLLTINDKKLSSPLKVKVNFS
jgi:hypothetical protein